MDLDAAMRLIQSKLTLHRKRMDVSAIKQLMSRISALKTQESAEDLVLKVILYSTETVITNDMYTSIITALESKGTDIFKASAIQSLDDTAPFYSIYDNRLVLDSGMQSHTLETLSITAKLRIAFLQKHLSQYISATLSTNSDTALFASYLNSCRHLSSLALLEGHNASHSTVVVVVGILHNPRDTPHLELEDETALITLLTNKIRYSSIQGLNLSFPDDITQISLPLLDQSIVAVIGVVDDGKLRANAIFTPPIETPEGFNNMMGADKTPAHKKIFGVVHTNTPEFGLVFSQVLFSDHRCVNDFVLMLKEYDKNTDAKYIPSHIIIFGVFCKGRQPSPSDALTSIRNFLDILIHESLSNVFERTLFVFAPHKTDPSLSGNVYPRQLFSDKTIKVLEADYQMLKLSFPTTPFHLVYGHQTFVLSSMPHEEVFVRLTKDSTAMSEIDGYSATHEELANFIVSQKNLFPFPHSMVPRLWGIDPMLNIIPLPSGIILADGTSAHYSVASGVTVASPGSFYTDKTYIIFHAAKTDTPIDILQLNKQMDSEEG